MASCGLTRKSCGRVFKHSEIDNTLENCFFPVKPQLPPGSAKSACPICKAEFSYPRDDLRYQRGHREAR